VTVVSGRGIRGWIHVILAKAGIQALFSLVILNAVKNLGIGEVVLNLQVPCFVMNSARSYSAWRLVLLGSVFRFRQAVSRYSSAIL